MGRLLFLLLSLLTAGLTAGASDLDLHLDSDDWIEWQVRSIRLTGLAHTDSTVLLRELEMTSGYGYSDQALQSDIYALQNTQLFARLVVTVHADSTEEAIDLVYAVAERPRYLAYPVLSPTETGGWIYGFAMMNENISGTGRFLRMSMENGEHLNYSLELGDPWFLGVRRPVTLKLNSHVSESPEEDYERRFKSVGINWRRYFDRQFSVALNPYLSELRIRDFRSEPEAVTINPKGLDVIAGCSVSLDMNTTDVHLRPRQGVHAKARMDGFGLAGSNQPQGLAFDAELAWFGQAPIVTNAILGVRTGVGATSGRRGDYMKRYLGGSRRVRAGLPGDWPGWSQCFASAEFRLPLVDRRLYFKHIDIGLGFVVFADGGLSWKEEFHGSSLAAGGFGLGLRVFAPFIEVGRLDVAWNPDSGIVVYAARGHAF